MRIVKWLIGLVAVLAIVFLGGGFLLPKDVSVARSIEIEAPASDIFPHINNLKAAGEWSPWLGRDPEVELTYSGPEEGVGAKLVWASEDPQVGNGTQEIFWDDPSVFYASSHQMPLFPGTGALNERGKDDDGTIVNAPLRPGTGTETFKAAMDDRILPALERFSPDLILISAGFDAHHRDPLANIELGDADFGWVTARLMDLADRLCGGRVVSMLEGGYDLQGLSGGVAAHMRALQRGAAQ